MNDEETEKLNKRKAKNRLNYEKYFKPWRERNYEKYKEYQREYTKTYYINVLKPRRQKERLERLERKKLNTSQFLH